MDGVAPVGLAGGSSRRVPRRPAALGAGPCPLRQPQADRLGKLLPCPTGVRVCLLGQVIFSLTLIL